MNNTGEPSTEPPRPNKRRKKAETGLTVRDAAGIAVTDAGLKIIRDMARLGTRSPRLPPPLAARGRR